MDKASIRREKVVIGIATIPGREKALEETLASLKGQADHIIVGQDIRLGDATKFKPFFPIIKNDHESDDIFGEMKYSGYFLTCDDDLIYPPDYVSTIIKGIERYNRKAVVTFHGKRVDFKAPWDPWYKFLGMRYPCLKEVYPDYPIHVPGTGCMGWHSSTVQFTWDDFLEPNMADIWAGKKLEEAGIPRYVLAHDEGWIKHTDKIDMNDTLWRTNKKDEDKTAYMTEVFESVAWQNLS